MRLNKLVFPICCALLCSSCAQDVANRYYGAQRYPERDPRSVELLFHAPSRPFNVIADFQSRGESPEAFRERAAKIGADAVIVTRVGGLYRRSEEWAGSDTMVNTSANLAGHLIGSAIKYTQ
jgi:hypothetical protein